MAEKAFCVKCRKKVTVEGATTKTLKSGRKALVGKCPSCGTKVFKFIKG
jgi:DNA-directed RNA polymerase subunit RPC12/RpoP